MVFPYRFAGNYPPRCSLRKYHLSLRARPFPDFAAFHPACVLICPSSRAPRNDPGGHSETPWKAPPRPPGADAQAEHPVHTGPYLYLIMRGLGLLDLLLSGHVFHREYLLAALASLSLFVTLRAGAEETRSQPALCRKSAYALL